MPENFLSSKLFENAIRLIPGGVNSPVRAFRNVDGDPFFVRAAKGSRLWDVDDNELIDYVGTWGPAILGHAPVPVIEAVHEAAKRGVSFGTPNPFEIEMAKIIVDWVPSVEKVRMVNSGTEATMSSIRLARGFTGRDKIIKFEGCYHGHVDSLLVAAGSGALTHGEPDSAGIPKAFASETITLPFNDQEKVKEIFSAHGSDIAAVILEPIPANAGLFFPEEGFLELLRELTNEYGSLLIFDEVMTGFRVAKGGAQELYGIMPDLTALGKVIGGGLPVGAFGGKAEIMDQLAPDGPVYQAGTLSGNPLAMAAGLAQLKELDKLQGWQRLEETGALFEKGVREALSKAGKEYIFHRIGSMFCLFFTNSPVRDLDSATAAAESGSFKGFFHYCLKNGVFLAPSPYETGFISMAHSEEDILQTVQIIENALT
ncbi:MAG: glutamate-1-semialdehyde 2,1-aminomutase [Verrucomicrobiales bacterium]|nr:glutamate-1-semialdehyde 2,1-aminomutase [Verrucomicrobiales bacterium]|tara:strand:+ start:148 stop:1431 length:1284 start_codon:yes stop_codon:yes gene_type:complete